jgi:hypothetical protein
MMRLCAQHLKFSEHYGADASFCPEHRRFSANINKNGKPKASFRFPVSAYILAVLFTRKQHFYLDQLGFVGEDVTETPVTGAVRTFLKEGSDTSKNFSGKGWC